MGIVVENRRELKAELMDSDNAASHRYSCCCVVSYDFFADRYDMSVAAVAILDKIKNIYDNKPASQDVTRPRRSDEREVIPIHRAELKSRKERLGKIIKALGSDDVNAVGVYGMGGSGKTMLAKEVNNTKADGIFQTSVMVEISESPNIESIQDQIADGLGMTWPDVHGIRQKADRLYDRLKEKSEERKDDNSFIKILIVLDNIWKQLDLAEIGISREFCTLLLTTREKEVCISMDVQEDYILELDLLNKDEAKDLFKFQVKKDVNIGEYKSLSDRLLEKCGGLPLSIVATANSLKGKGLPFWRHFAEELEKPISCQISGVHHETFSILKTSYEFMASEEKKKFFLLACLSPLGSSISIDDLMRFGIGLGLFQNVNKLSEAMKQAHIWAEELVSSSMLLEGASKEKVTIHDVVRECIMSFASKSLLNKDRQLFLVDAIPRWIFQESFSQYTGISLLNHANYARLNGVKAELLQILLLKGDTNEFSTLEPNFFQGMTNLKVLKMLYMDFSEGLPESMGKLKDLKTLHLVKCLLGDIKLIGKLKSLLVLSLRKSYLEELPDEIGKLSNLQLLDLRKCRSKQSSIPANVISNLWLLEGLYLFGSCFTEWAVTESMYNVTGVTNGATIDELNKLFFLNVLEINISKPMYLPICDQFVQNLDKFQIRVGGDYSETPSSQRLLAISKFDVSQELKKGNCLKALLKKADFLSLQTATVKNNIVPELDKEGFKDLSHLELDDIQSISRICEGKAPTGLFCNLLHLIVSALNNLEELLPVNPIPQKLTLLDIRDCPSLTYIFHKNVVNKESDAIELPCLKILNICHVNRLRGVVKQSNNDDNRHQSFFSDKVKLPSLEGLSFTYAMSIVKLWDKESNVHSFQNLKELIIDGCEKMETIGPPSIFLSLLQLELLFVKKCNAMQNIISKESESQDIPQEIITFPKLMFMKIVSSKNFKCFYGGSCKLEFPRLESLDLFHLQSMTKFAGCSDSTTFFNDQVEFPLLKELELNGLSDKVKLTSIVFKSLTCLKVRPVCDAKFLFSSSQNEGCLGTYSEFPKLVDLIVQHCPRSVEEFIEDDGSTAMKEFCGQLSRLTLIVAVNMKVISLHHFKSLCNICISCLPCENILAADGGFEQLQFLEELKIEYCEKLEVIISGGDRDNAIVFPRLKILRLENLDRLSKFSSILDTPFHFLSLELLNIKSCSKLETICSGAFVAPELREVEVSVCHELLWLISGEPNQAIELPSLEEVSIYECDALKCFSTSPIKAPILKRIEVKDCSEMEWFLSGNTNSGDQTLPYLNHLRFFSCPNIKSFCSTVIRAPRLTHVVVNGIFHYPVTRTEDLNQFFSPSDDEDDM